MTGSTGTPRYMSPEVALEKPYNESCDTYSFCILLWEILALNTAFELYTWASFRSRVWQAPYKRPYINPVSCAWPKEVQSLLQQGWDNDLTCRQPMSEIVETLRKEAIRSSDALDEQWGLEIERRSTHVFDEGDLQHLHGSHKSLLSLIASPLRTSNRFREPKVEYGGIRSPLFNPNKKKTKELAATLDSTAATSIMSESQYNSRSSGHLSPRLSNILQLQPPLEDNGEEQVEIQQPKQMKQRPGLVSTPSEIFRHVKAETVRRQRNRIMDVQDEEDDEVLISPKSTPSKIYKEVKDESVRRQRRRIFVDSSDSKDDEDDMGYNNMSPAAPRLSESQENKNSSPPSVKTTARPSPIWNRIREENLRQKQIRMRLKSSRDNAVVPSQ